MWSNGTNGDPGWPTLNKDAYDPWREARANFQIFRHREREEDTRRTPGGLANGLGGLMFLLVLIGESALVRLRGLLAGQSVQALLLGGIGLCWFLGRRWSRHLLLGLVLGGLLTGCQDMSRRVLLLTGCEEQAIDDGYCHMPKEVKR